MSEAGDYILLVQKKPQELVDQVNCAIADGYVPIGGISLASNEFGHARAYAQALVKVDDDD